MSLASSSQKEAPDDPKKAGASGAPRGQRLALSSGLRYQKRDTSAAQTAGYLEIANTTRDAPTAGDV